MQNYSGKIGILGAGALGAFYGARLFRAGNNVHFLVRSAYETMKREGLHLKSFGGDFHIHPPVFNKASELGICDLVIVGLKTTDNAHLPTMLAEVCNNDTVVLTLQNGLGSEDAMVEALSQSPSAGGQVMGGIAFLCSNRLAPNIIHHIAHGWIRMGEHSGPAKPRTHTIAEMFRHAGINCEVYDSLLTARWEKLVWNIPFNGLGAAASAHTAAILADPRLRQLARELMDEVVLAATADSIILAKDLPEKMMRNTETMGPYRTSMQIDCELDIPPEVEAILGEPLRRARRANISTPKLEWLYNIVKKGDRMR